MPAVAPALPPGQRIYAIGDIHGRDDLLGALLIKIDLEAKKAGVSARKIFLGDYIDRGLYSRQVIERLIKLRETEREPPVFLLGNHEQVMRDIVHGRDGDLLQDWLRFGGRETLMSYGIAPTGDPHAVAVALRDKLPPAHAAFIEKLQTHITFGDYFFCHAGIRPGIPLEKQVEQDLVWIRYEFLSSKEPHGKVVVHGHTITTEAELRPNRINVDTGAYATGCLTALGLEGKKQWLLQTK